MSTIKVDTVRPVTADASLTLQGDSGGSGVTGLTIDSSGVVNTTTAKVTNIQATSGQSLTIKDEDGNAAITIGTDNTATSYLSLNFGSYHGGSGSITNNSLSDYETGTFTPVIEGGSTSGTGTYSSATGNYTKIGNVVIFRFSVVWSAHTGTGIINIAGFPFNPSVLTYYSVQTENISLAASHTALIARVGTFGSGSLVQSPVGGGARALVSMDTAGDIQGSGVYLT